MTRAGASATPVRRGRRTTLPRGGFSAETFDRFIKRPPRRTTLLTDDVQPGLRAVIRKGSVSFHVCYEVADRRPMLKIGEHPAMTVKEARELARTIRVLAANGIDPQEGLHDRLIRELKDQGTEWRP